MNEDRQGEATREALRSSSSGLINEGRRVAGMRPDAVEHRLSGWEQLLRQQWRTPDNYTLVLVLIVLAFLVVAATEGRPEARILALVLLGSGLVFALHTSKTAVGFERLAIVAVAAGVVLAVVSIVVTGSLGLASHIDRPVVAVLVVATPVVISRRLVHHRRVTQSTVSGALCVYLLIGLAFASLFGITEVLGGGPFFAGQVEANDADFLYFSFTTLATVGYGDLVARTNLGRMLAVTEALMGQLYLVTVVALLVGSLGRSREDHERDP